MVTGNIAGIIGLVEEIEGTDQLIERHFKWKTLPGADISATSSRALHTEVAVPSSHNRS